MNPINTGIRRIRKIVRLFGMFMRPRRTSV
jgi:hypothetical protein